MSVNIFQNNALKKIAGNYAIDSSLSATSENAVMNKVVTAALGAVGGGVIGTQAEIEGKIQRGEIAPGSIVQITDDAADTITGLQVTTSAVPGQTTVEGALSTINTQLTVTSETRIDCTGQSSGSGALFYRRCGKIVMVYGVFNATIDITSVNGQWVGLPKPYAQFDSVATLGGYVQLRTDGGLRNYATKNGSNTFEFTYFTSD